MTDFLDSTIDYLKRGLRYVGIMSKEPTEEDKANDWTNRIIDAMELAYDAQAEAFRPIDQAGPEYIRGNQARFLTIPDYWVPAVENVLAPLVNQEQAILASRTPDIQCSALDEATPEEIEATKLWEGHLRWQMLKNIDIQTLMTRAHDDAAGYGWWVTSAWWDEYRRYDKNTQGWEAQVRVKLCHPMTFRGDPQAEHWKEMHGRFVKCLLPTNDLLRRYADRSGDDDKTKAEKKRKRQIILTAAARAGQMGYGKGRDEDGKYMVTRSDPVTETVNAPYICNWSGQNEPGRVLDAINLQCIPEYPTGPDEPQSFASSLIVLEAIWDDYTTKKEDKTTPMGREDAEGSGRIVKQEHPESKLQLDYDTQSGAFIDDDGANWPSTTETREVPMYPYGRHVIRVGDKGIIEDEPWPYEHSLWTIGLNGYLPHCWRGENDVERCRPSQDVHNVEAMEIRNFKDNFLAPILKIAEGTNPHDPKNDEIQRWLRSRPGAAVSTSKEGYDKIGFVEFPPLPEWMQEEHERSSQLIKDQYGQHNTTEGKESQHEKTLGEVQITSANDRYRTGLKGVLVDMFAVDLADQVCELCREHLSVDDLIRIIDERGAGGWAKVTQEMLDAEFEIDLETTTALPMDKQIRRQEAVLFMQQIVETQNPALINLAVKWLVKAFDPPDADEILQTLKLAPMQTAATGGGVAGNTPQANVMGQGQPQVSPAGFVDSQRNMVTAQ